MFEYLRLIKEDWIPNVARDWHGYGSLIVIAVAVVLVALVVKRRN